VVGCGKIEAGVEQGDGGGGGGCNVGGWEGLGPGAGVCGKAPICIKGVVYGVEGEKYTMFCFSCRVSSPSSQMEGGSITVSARSFSSELSARDCG
jgi:hypothetical protein